jgi:hypothetical protein
VGVAKPLPEIVTLRQLVELVTAPPSQIVEGNVTILEGVIGVMGSVAHISLFH